MEMIEQLPLPVQLADSATFDNFFQDRASEVIACLKQQVAAPTGWKFTYLWGGRGSGKSHLLQAVCHLCTEEDHPASYIPLSIATLNPSILENLGDDRVVCIDDLDSVAGDPLWEEGLMGLLERARYGGGVVISAARAAPAGIGFKLPDLISRFGSQSVYQLHDMDDEARMAAFRQRAGRRGLDLSGEVVRYVLNRYQRDTHALFGLLERLDHASLVAKRRLTIPFLKQLEENSPAASSHPKG